MDLDGLLDKGVRAIFREPGHLGWRGVRKRVIVVDIPQRIARQPAGLGIDDLVPATGWITSMPALQAGRRLRNNILAGRLAAGSVNEWGRRGGTWAGENPRRTQICTGLAQ